MEKITPLKNGIQPYQNLYDEHLHACAEDAAMVLFITKRTPNIEEADIFARRLAGLRRRCAQHLPCVILPTEHPYELAELKNSEEFKNHFREISARARLSDKTENVEAVVRGMVLSDSSYIIPQVFSYARRHNNSNFLNSFMNAANARRLFCDDSGIARLNSGIDLHSKIEDALKSIGINPDRPQYPKNPPTLKFV